MDSEQQIKENTRNIASLTNTVTQLTTMFEFTEKAREEERQDVKTVVSELKAINQKITEMSSIQRDVTQLSSDFRTISHDVRDIQSAIQAISLLKDRLTDDGKKLENHETRLDAIEAWRNELKGGTGAVKIVINAIWAVVAAGGLSFIAWLFTSYNKVSMVIGKIGGE